MTVTTHTETTDDGETLAVARWRFVTLERAGIGSVVAAQLAAGSGDLHAIERAHERGCPDATLYRIFRDGQP